MLNIAPNQPKLQLRKTIAESKTATRIHKQICIHAIIHYSQTVSFLNYFLKTFRVERNSYLGNYHSSNYLKEKICNT